MKARRSQSKNHSPESSQEQIQEKKVKKMSQFYDYISMRAHLMQNQKFKTKKKSVKRIQKHSLQVHAHLQPDLPFQQEQDGNDDGNNPITIMANYNTQAYNQWIQTMKTRVSNQKPYTDQHPLLIDVLAMKKTNVCIYGFGSKIQYLRYLRKTYLSDHYVWQVNGYTQGLTQKKIYNNFGKFLQQIGITTQFKQITMEKQLFQFHQSLKKYAKNNDKQIIVLFHCLDSMNFLNSDAQFLLSSLFKLPLIKLVCSIDCIKIATVWHPKTKTNFHFKFFHINTRVPYILQQLFRPNATDIRQREDQAIRHIYQSLSYTQKRVLKLLAKQQLDNCNRQQPQYFTRAQLLQQCIDNAILCSDVQLNQNLSQLIDHKVIVVKQKIQAERVRKYYTIQCNKAMLERILCQKIQD